MAKSGARLSMFPMRMPHWHTMTVIISALVGSPDADDLANGCRNGMMSSLAMAWQNGSWIVLLSFWSSRERAQTNESATCRGTAIDYRASLLTCNNLGAPVRLWSPAPSVDSVAPTRITHSLGHAMLATTRRPPILCPNLCQKNTRVQLTDSSY